MHHAVEKSPEQNIGEKPPDEAPGEKQPPRLEALVPPPTGFEDEEHREEEGGQEVEDEAVQAGETQDARGGSGQG